MFEHLEVESSALLLPVCLQFHVIGVKPLQPVIQFSFDILERLVETLLTGHVELSRMDPCLLEVIKRLPRDRLTDLDSLDTIPTEADAQWIISARHPDIEHLAAQTDVTTRNLAIGASVL